YHSAEMAFDSPANLKRLRLEDPQKPESARVEGTYVSSSGARYPDPARRSFVIDFKKDFELCGVRAKDSGRVIFIVPQYISDVRPWSRLILRTFTSTGTPVNSEIEDAGTILGRNGWPFLPVFASVRLEADALVLELADEKRMRQIAD